MSEGFLILIYDVSRPKFAGAAFYINVAEQPARLGLDDKSLLKKWKPSYASSFAMQGSLAVVSGVLGLVAAWLTKDWRWVVGAALILTNWPHTVLGMMPTNNKLKGISENDAGPTARTMIETWDGCIPSEPHSALQRQLHTCGR